MSKIGLFTTRMLSSRFPNFGKTVYKSTNFRKYGLMIDDMIRLDLPEVKEALRRLPPQVAQERQFRISRALQLSVNKTFLPKEEWMTPEKEQSYLNDLIEEVQKEQEEVLAYDTRFYSFKSGDKL